MGWGCAVPLGTVFPRQLRTGMSIFDWTAFDRIRDSGSRVLTASTPVPSWCTPRL